MREGDARLRASDVAPSTATALWRVFVRMYAFVCKREGDGE